MSVTTPTMFSKPLPTAACPAMALGRRQRLTCSEGGLPTGNWPEGSQRAAASLFFPEVLRSHARAWRGHPRLKKSPQQDVDGRNEPGHDGGVTQRQSEAAG